MAQYDEQILQQFADRVYRKAARVTLTYLVVGALLGALIGLTPVFIWSWKGTPASQPSIGGSELECIVLFGLIFASVGESKRFAWKLQAQVTLCQMQIERNT